jgi:Holliday junction resolvase-like predicted endonuclease
VRPQPDDLFRYLDALDGTAFERVVARLLEHDGYHVDFTKRFDWGADLIALRDEVRWAVQVKRWSHPVREDAVRAVYAGKEIYKCDRAMVITNSSFTKRARSAAKQLNVALWDRERLVREIQWFCAVCGVKVSPRVKGWCLDRPHLFHGALHCFDHQRDAPRAEPVSDTSGV